MGEWKAKWNSRQSTRIPGMHYLSDFFNFGYWIQLKTHHLLDSMHVIKNVSSSLLLHILGDKDTVQARADLKVDNSKKELWEPDEDGQYVPAPWILTKGEQQEFFLFMQSIKTPTGFGSELANAFNKQDRFSGLKSHDFLNLLRYFIPIALRGYLTPGLREAISRLSRLVRWITSKSISKDFLPKMETEAMVVMSLLEMQFPTSFFDSQVHDLIHIVQELGIAGPIQNRNMFFVERFLKTLKGFVRQQAKPEGSMAEGYLVQEAMGRCHELIKGLHEYTTIVWHDEEDPKETGMRI
jgi:hypothetical protein